MNDILYDHFMIIIYFILFFLTRSFFIFILCSYPLFVLFLLFLTNEKDICMSCIIYKIIFNTKLINLIIKLNLI